MMIDNELESEESDECELTSSENDRLKQISNEHNEYSSFLRSNDNDNDYESNDSVIVKIIKTIVNFVNKGVKFIKQMFKKNNEYELIV
jgi:hypothetical protein